MEIAAMLASIPYLEGLAIEVTAERPGAIEMRMPMGRAVHNIIGTIHAGALFTLAETAAGVAAFRAAPGDNAMVLLRTAEVRYTRRAEGDLVVTARAAPEEAKAAGAAFEADGRADLDIEVAITDDQGEPVFVGIFDYALRARKS